MALRGDALAYATLDYLREHPEEWDQCTFFCRSTACFAGRAILLAKNCTLANVNMLDLWNDPEAYAQELLGWTDAQAYEVFFFFTSDFTALENRVKQVLNGEIK